MVKKNTEQVNCAECNLSIKLPILAVREKALCPRCGYLLTVHYPEAFERILAYGFTALIFLVLALAFDFVSLIYQGQTYTITLLGTYAILDGQGYLLIGLLLMLTVIILPLLVIGALFYLLFSIQTQHYPVKGLLVAKGLLILLPWSMAEIFLIGVLVSLIKISATASVGLGLSFYAYVLFAISYIAAIQYIDKQQLISALQQLKAKTRQDKEQKIVGEVALEKKSIGNNSLEKTSLEKNSLEKNSIQKTWALLLTALFLYFPANLLPIMTTRSLGKDELNTILGGVIVLWQAGSYPVAIVIFIASIVVPVIKFIVLAWLNYTVSQQDSSFQLQRAQLYRIVEFIGRWSMIDVFAVAILASLIQLGTAMIILPGHAAIAFCGVVILTMLAANTFDSTLIWKKTIKI
jgi:paraquat-inducible protein A